MKMKLLNSMLAIDKIAIVIIVILDLLFVADSTQSVPAANGNQQQITNSTVHQRRRNSPNIELRRLNRTANARFLSDQGESFEDNESYARAPSQYVGTHQVPQSRGLTREGVAEVQRVARNVNKKMELLDGRVHQIESIIDENHRTSPPAPIESPYGNLNSSSEIDSDPLPGDDVDASPASSSQPSEFGRGDNKSSGEATMSSASVINNNIEAPATTNEVWSSASSAESDSDERQRQAQEAGGAATRTNLETKRSAPKIQSVIPGRSASLSSSSQSAPISGTVLSDNVILRNLELDKPNEDGAQSDDGKVHDEQQTAASVQDLPNDSEKSQSNGANQTAQTETPQALPSMMGPEWSTHQNHYYFSDLNEKNHGGSQRNQARDSEHFKPLAIQPLRSNRFSNMTVVDSPIDLTNSFSSNQPSPSVSTNRSPGDHMMPSSAPKKSSVRTYSSSNYGKSTSDRSLPNRSVSFNETLGGKYSSSNEEQDPLKWPAFATSFSSSVSAAPQSRSDNNMQADNNNIGLPPTGSGTSDHYSGIMQPASNLASTASHQDSSGRSHRASENEHLQQRQHQANKFSPLIATNHEQSPGEGQVSSAAANSNLKHRISGSGTDDSNMYNYSNLEPVSPMSPVGNDLGNAFNSPQVGSDLGGSMQSSPVVQDSPNLDFGDQTNYANSRLQPASYNHDRTYYSQPSDGASVAPESGALSPSIGYQPSLSRSQPGELTQTDPQQALGDSMAPPPQIGAGNSASDTDGAVFDPKLYQLAMALRNSHQESMQPAATSNNNNLMRQHNQMINVGSHNQAYGSIDANILQRYQQQQRYLAAQLQLQQLQQQQQQLQQQQTENHNQNQNVNPNSRAFYVTSNEQQQQQQPQPGEHSVARRYSPEPLVNYLQRLSAYQQPQQQQFVPADYGQISAATTSDLLTPYSMAGNQYQPTGTALYANPTVSYDPRLIRAANSAILRAALASASARNAAIASQTADSSPQTTYYIQQPQQPTGGTSTAAANNNYSSGSLYATSAMHSPVFHDASSQPVKSTDGSVQSSAAVSVPSSPAHDAALGGASLQQQQQQQRPFGPYKRSYLNNLFKPSASSRYYYTPTILSPISFSATPTALHSIYAPTLATADPMATLPQVYTTAAAATPYAQLAPSSLTGTAVDPSQHYQAFAAAAAASGLQPHYMDTEMAESSLIPSDSSSLNSDGSSSGGSGSSSSDDSGSSGSSSTSKSGSKSATPWTNIAGLLLGILPFGILMASLLPAVTVAGRKKRELEFSGRNFSDLLKWRPPSQVLNAIIGQPGELSLANATAIINEQFANLAQKSGHNQQTGQNQQQQIGKRRSLTSGVGLFRWDRAGNKQHADGSPAHKTTDSLSSDSSQVDANSTSTTLSSPSPSTTPMPNISSLLVNQTSASVKAKVKRAFNVLNNFIIAAQNIKRKHRSSVMESQWSLPAILKSTLKLDNLFNVEEYKRNLAALVHARLLAAQKQFLQQQQSQKLSSPSDSLAVETRAEARAGETKQSSPTADLQQQVKLPPKQELTSSTTKSPTRDSSAQPTQLLGMKEPANKPLFVTLVVSDNSTQKSVSFESSKIAPPQPKFAPAETSESDQEIQNSSKRFSAFRIKPQFMAQVDSGSNSATKLPADGQQTSLKNSTMNHLEVCLNQFLCRLTVKLNKSLSNSLAEKTKPSNSSLSSSEQLEKITKKYINQLVEQIETEHPAVSLGLKPKKKLDASSAKDSPEQGLTEEDGLDTLYKSAMKDQCSSIYKCAELLQLERTLAKMKLKFS